MMRLDLANSAERLAKEYASTLRQGKGIVIKSDTLTEKGLDSFVNETQCAIERITKAKIIPQRVSLTNEGGYARYCLFSPDSPAAQKLINLVRIVRTSSFREKETVPKAIHSHNNNVRDRYLKQIASREVKDAPEIEVR